MDNNARACILHAMTPDAVQIIAEIGANHSRSLDKTRRMIEAAAAAGASAVKVQLYTPEQMTLQSAAEEFCIREGLWAGSTLWDLYSAAAMPHEWTPELLQLAEERGLAFIASVFHPDMVPVAESYGVPTYKVSSFEIGYKNLLEAVDRTDKPVILSTGTATLDEIGAAVLTFAGKKLALLKCTSCYPAPPDRMNLVTIPDLRERFGVPVGLSDHTTGIVCPVVAVSLGATVIEKHFKIDEDGFDVAFSLDPQQFALMVRSVREAKAALGRVDYTPSTAKYKRREVGGRWLRTVN
jgi:sialic acid synthase SpsE